MSFYTGFVPFFFPSVAANKIPPLLDYNIVWKCTKKIIFHYKSEVTKKSILFENNKIPKLVASDNFDVILFAMVRKTNCSCDEITKFNLAIWDDQIRRRKMPLTCHKVRSHFKVREFWFSYFSIHNERLGPTFPASLLSPQLCSLFIGRLLCCAFTFDFTFFKFFCWTNILPPSTFKITFSFELFQACYHRENYLIFHIFKTRNIKAIQFLCEESEKQSLSRSIMTKTRLCSVQLPGTFMSSWGALLFLSISVCFSISSLQLFYWRNQILNY